MPIDFQSKSWCAVTMEIRYENLILTQTRGGLLVLLVAKEAIAIVEGGRLSMELSGVLLIVTNLQEAAKEALVACDIPADQHANVLNLIIDPSDDCLPTKFFVEDSGQLQEVSEALMVDRLLVDGHIDAPIREQLN